MNKVYEKPAVIVDEGLAEGVYAASGAGSLTVTDAGVWDRWDGGGKHGFTMSWAGLTGMVSATLNFNDTVDEVAAEGSGVQTSVSGNTVTITFDSSVADNPMYIGCHLNHGTSIDSLSVTGYTYSAE